MFHTVLFWPMKKLQAQSSVHAASAGWKQSGRDTEKGFGFHAENVYEPVAQCRRVYLIVSKSVFWGRMYFSKQNNVE